MNRFALPGQAQPEMPIFGTGEGLADPVAQFAEIGVGQPIAAPYEQQGTHPGERPLHGLSMLITSGFVRRANPRVTGFRLLPEAMQMHDPFVVTPQHALNLGAIPPCHGWTAGDGSEQIVIVDRGERDAEIAQRFQDIGMPRLESADRLAEEPLEFTAGGRPKFSDTCSATESSSARSPSSALRCRSAQPLAGRGCATSAQRSIPSRKSPPQPAASARRSRPTIRRRRPLPPPGPWRSAQSGRRTKGRAWSFQLKKIVARRFWLKTASTSGYISHIRMRWPYDASIRT